MTTSTMADLSFRPITRWPDGWQHPDRHRTRVPTPFRATYAATLCDLGDELHHLDAATWHAQLAGIRPADLRRDGLLRAHTKVEHPGVILTVVTPTRTLVLGTDRFHTSWANQGQDWHHNLRACVLGLRDLRRVDRYGLVGAHGGDQYAGFAALPPGGPVALGAGMGLVRAREILVSAAGLEQPPVTPDEVQAAYRAAARRLHPDTSDGDAQAMAEVNRARDVLLAGHR